MYHSNKKTSQQCVISSHYHPFSPLIESTQFSPQSVKQKVHIHPFSQAKWTATLTHFCHYLNCFENSFYLFSTSKKIKFPFNEKSFLFLQKKRVKKLRGRCNENCNVNRKLIGNRAKILVKIVFWGRKINLKRWIWRHPETIQADWLHPI